VDTSLPEKGFWNDLNSTKSVISFKRISTKKEGTLTPTRIIELKFLSPKIPDSLSIYNVIFKITPNVRYPLQCNNCLSFGHTTKFCRSKTRYSHCSENNQSINVCPQADSTEPLCISCQLPPLSTDRRCREWYFQRDVKKIMATENIPFCEAISHKEKNYSSSAFSYTNIVNK